MPASIKYLSDPKELAENVISVLAKWSDGRYYKVDVIECDKATRKCYVKFEDDHKCWMEAKKLHLELSIDKLQIDHIVCCVCDDGQSFKPNEIILCDLCQQGYHFNCHRPAIDREKANLDDENVEWLCATCKHLSSLPDDQSYVSEEFQTPKSAKSTKKSPKSSKKTASTRKRTSAAVSPAAAKIKLNKKDPLAIKDATDSLITNKSDPPAPLNESDFPVIFKEEQTNSSMQKDGQPMEVDSVSEQGQQQQPDAATIKTKAFIKKNVNDTTNLSKERLPNGATLEEMDPLVISVAKALAVKETNVETDDFVKLIANKPIEAEVMTKSSNKLAGTKLRKATKAAAY